MGRAADTAPTFETVNDTIASLKRAKREAWANHAKQLQVSFEAYVIEKIRRNIQYRRWRRMHAGIQQGEKSDVDGLPTHAAQSTEHGSRSVEYGSKSRETKSPSGDLALVSTQVLEK